MSIALNETSKADVLKADTSGAQNEINFLNNSAVVWAPDTNQKPPNEFGYNLVSWPGASLAAMDGAATCIVQDVASKLGAGGTGDENYFFFCWNDGTYRFGVKINVNLQLFGMGDRPSWQVMWDQNLNSPDITWQSNGDDPADQFSWPSSLGYGVVATPTSNHQSLSIKVMITNS